MMGFGMMPTPLAAGAPNTTGAPAWGDVSSAASFGSPVGTFTASPENPATSGASPFAELLAGGLPGLGAAPGGGDQSLLQAAPPGAAPVLAEPAASFKGGQYGAPGAGLAQLLAGLG